MATTQQSVPLMGSPTTPPTGPVIVTMDTDTPTVGVVSTTTRGPIDAAAVTSVMAVLRTVARTALPQPPPV